MHTCCPHALGMDDLRHPNIAGGSQRQWGVKAALAEATTDAADSDHQPDKSEDTRDEAPSAGVQAPASVWLPFKTASEKKVGTRWHGKGKKVGTDRTDSWQSLSAAAGTVSSSPVSCAMCCCAADGRQHCVKVCLLSIDGGLVTTKWQWLVHSASIGVCARRLMRLVRQLIASGHWQICVICVIAGFV